MKDEYEIKMEYADNLIAECEQLKQEWEKRIQEAEALKEQYKALIEWLSVENELANINNMMQE